NGGRDFNYSHKSLPAKYHVRKGDLLFGWSGNRGTSFGPFLWPLEGDYYLNQHIFRLDGYQYDKMYFYWLLRAVTTHVESQVHGIIGLVHITKVDIGKIVVPKIPADEQRAIASYVDHQVAKLDAAIIRAQRE